MILERYPLGELTMSEIGIFVRRDSAVKLN